MFRLHTSTLSRFERNLYFLFTLVDVVQGRKPDITPASRPYISREHVAMKLIRFFMEDNDVMTVSVIPQYKPLIAEFKDIDKLSSSDFEIFVRDLFVASGWTDAEITKTGKEFKHGDGGVDIFAWKGRRKFAIEVKQRQLGTTVDVKALNQLVTGATLANVTYKILVTNSGLPLKLRRGRYDSALS